MEQKITNDPKALVVELDIDNREVFSEDFKHYAKMLYLGQVNRSMMSNAFSMGPDGIQLGGMDPHDPKTKERTLKEIATCLCGVAARSVATLMSDIAEELSDDAKLNAAMIDLFGDAWDPENKEFKRK